MKLYIFLLVLVSFSSLAQKEYNQIIADSIKATDKQKEGLGLLVLSEEDNKTVMLSKTGRYIVKGTVIDMWDGVQRSANQYAKYPTTPEMLDINEFAISYGEPTKPEITAYLSFSCRQCSEVAKQLSLKSIKERYFIKIILVDNNPDDRLVNSSIFCSKSRYEAFKAFYVDRDLTNLNKSCPSMQAKNNVLLANAQNIKALPVTFFKDSNMAYLGALPEQLLDGN